MPRQYEVVYIFESALEDPAIAEKLTRFHALLGAHGAPPPDLAVDLWGRRQLATMPSRASRPSRPSCPSTSGHSSWIRASCAT